MHIFNVIDGFDTPNSLSYLVVGLVVDGEGDPRVGQDAQERRRDATVQVEDSL